MPHFCCSRSPAPSWFTSQAAAILPTRAIRAHSVGTAGRDARARGDPAIPPRQHRRLAALRALSPFVRAAAVDAAASAERNARRVAVALRTGARLRLDHPGVAEQRLVLQSAGL